MATQWDLKGSKRGLKGSEGILQGAAVFTTALLTVDKINIDPKPKCPHEICIFPMGYRPCLSKRLPVPEHEKPFPADSYFEVSEHRMGCDTGSNKSQGTETLSLIWSALIIIIDFEIIC